MVPVYGTTLVEHRVLVLRGDQKVFDGFATLEVSLDAIPTTDLFDTFAKTLCVGYDNMTLTLHSMVGRLGRVVAPIIDLSGRPVKSFLHFVQGPFGVVAFSESFPEEQAKHFKLEAGECLSSYDVSALFTSVPIDPALKVIKDLLVKDNTLKERTVMDVEDIILLLEFCLKNTYFSFQGQFYEQVEGAAMGSPVSPIVANLYMEYLEQKALSTAPNPPQILGQVCG